MRSVRAHAARAWDVNVVVAANAVVVVGMWLRHGGLTTLHQAGGVAIGAGQLTALLGTYAVLVQLLLMSRIGWLERWVGFDRLASWHRWGGFLTVVLLSLHVGLTTVGYAEQAHVSIGHQTGDFLRHYPDVLMATFGFVLLLAVAVSSVRIARRRLKRETWHALHLYAYAAVAISFAHQLATGADFTDDRLARVWWSALFVVVAAIILAWRVAWPIVFNARHQLRVHAIRREAEGVYSVYIRGRNLHEVRAEAGQFFLWRFVTKHGWAKAHPYSLSAVPGDKYLRITIKDLGDDSRRAKDLHEGVRVIAEGPYGTFTAQRRTRRKVALIAGGIGITPIRALVESLPADPGDIALLYRVAERGDVAFAKELKTLVDRRGLAVHLLVGSDIGDDRTDQLGLPALRAMLPDIAHRDVYVCGPPAMVDAVRRRLHTLRVPRAQVHFERFAY